MLQAPWGGAFLVVAQRAGAAPDSLWLPLHTPLWKSAVL